MVRKLMWQPFVVVTGNGFPFDDAGMSVGWAKLTTRGLGKSRWLAIALELRMTVATLLIRLTTPLSLLLLMKAMCPHPVSPSFAQSLLVGMTLLAHLSDDQCERGWRIQRPDCAFLYRAQWSELCFQSDDDLSRFERVVLFGKGALLALLPGKYLQQ